jgi:hypothetical protein
MRRRRAMVRKMGIYIKEEQDEQTKNKNKIERKCRINVLI